MLRVPEGQLSYFTDKSDSNFFAPHPSPTQPFERTRRPKKESLPFGYAQLSFITAELDQLLTTPKVEAPAPPPEESSEPIEPTVEEPPVKRPERKRHPVVQKERRARSIIKDLSTHPRTNAILEECENPLLLLIDGYGGGMHIICRDENSSVVFSPYRGDSYAGLRGLQFQGVIVDSGIVGYDMRLTIHNLLHIHLASFFAPDSLIVISEQRAAFDKPTTTQRGHLLSLFPSDFTVVELDTSLPTPDDDFTRDYKPIAAYRSTAIPQPIKKPRKKVESVEEIPWFPKDERPRKTKPEPIDIRAIAPRIVRLIGVGITDHPDDAYYIIGRPEIKGGRGWCSVDVKDIHGQSYSGSAESQGRSITPSVAKEVFALMGGEPWIKFSAADAMGEKLPTT